MEWMEKGCAAVGRAALWGNVLGCVLLGGMALLVTADVVMRGFGASLSGVFEVVEVLMGALVGCGLAYTGVTHSHLEVEILTDMMPRRVRHALGALGALLGCAFCAAVGWTPSPTGSARRQPAFRHGRSSACSVRAFSCWRWFP